MRRLSTASLALLLPLAAACASGDDGASIGITPGAGGAPASSGTVNGGGLGGASPAAPTSAGQGGSIGSGQGGSIGSGEGGSPGGGNGPSTTASSSSSSGSSSSSSSSSSGGVAPTTCAETNGSVGCCDGSGAFYYCSAGSTSVRKTTCTSGKVCGWNTSDKYYGCVDAPGGADPSNTYPMECN
jgi:hypothetical protein